MERIGTPGWLRPLGLVVALVLALVAVNHAAMGLLAQYGTNGAYRMVAAKYGLLDASVGQEPVDWLILGDSSGAHGIDPERWSAVTGGSSLNLSTVANLLVNNDVWMLREYIERVGKPKHVVLVHAFDVWDRGYKSALIGKIPREWGYWNTAPRVEVAPAHLSRVAVSRYLPLYSESRSLRTAFARWFRGAGDPFIMSPSGWVPPLAHDAVQLKRDQEQMAKHSLDRSSLKLSSHNLRALKVLVWVSNKYALDITLIHSPMSAELAGRRSFQSFHTHLDRALAEVTREAPRVRVVGELWAPPGRHLEQTVDHPNRASVPAFTTFSAAMVMEAQRRPLLR